MSVNVFLKEAGEYTQIFPIKNNEINFTIKENSTSFLDVEINGNDKFYIDGLKDFDYAHSEIEVNEDGDYWLTKSKKIYIYDNVRDNDVPNKYSPGYYKIEINCGGKITILCLTIKPKFGNPPFFTYGQMIYDIDSMVEGLSKDNQRLMRAEKELPLNRLFKLLKDKFDDFRMMLFDLKRYPQNEILKDYRTSKVVNGRIDQHSIQMMAKHPRQQYFIEQNKLEVNTRANQYFKYNLNQIQNKLNYVKKASKQRINFDVGIVDRYSEMINDFNYNSWMKDVSLKYVSIPAHLIDYRYRFVNDFLRELEALLKETNDVIKKTNNFLAANRSSYDLYEYWGFLKTIVVLKKMGFDFLRGESFESILNEKLKTSHSKITEGLPKQLCVEMNKALSSSQKLKVNVVYNDIMSNNKNDFEYIWIDSWHTKPDIRVDLFDGENTFIGAFIIDTKYRDVKYFWNANKGNETWQQMKDYYYNINSDKIFDSDRYQQINNLRTITQVGVMTPKTVNPYDSHDNYGVAPIRAIPGKDETDISSFITRQLKIILGNVDSLTTKSN